MIVQADDRVEINEGKKRDRDKKENHILNYAEKKCKTQQYLV